jgi:hypothetical protein
MAGLAESEMTTPSPIRRGSSAADSDRSPPVSPIPVLASSTGVIFSLMAYGNYLASVTTQGVQQLQRRPGMLLTPSRVVLVSHLAAYWVQVQPLGQILGEALDGGQPLCDGLWHPLRSPTYHTRSEVHRILRLLKDALALPISGEGAKKPEVFSHDVKGIVAVFEYALVHGEAVISVLEPPEDKERASRVRIPFAIAKG